MTRDEKVEQLNNGETLYFGNSWVGLSSASGKYEYYAFVGYQYSKRQFNSVSELVEYMDKTDGTWFDNYRSDYFEWREALED